MKKHLLHCGFTLLVAWLPADALAHGFAGKRFFPATPTTDDPFVADELSLPTLTQRRLPATGDSPATELRTASIDYTKRITPKFGVGFGVSHLRFENEDGTSEKGFDNLAANAKYRFYKNDEHESIASVGLDWDIGGSGARSVGAESFSTFTPGFFFGKGLGDLPEGAKYLRPLAVTGSLGLAMPEGRHDSDVLRLGLAVEYSVPYLQSFVKDVGLSAPFSRMIPLVEFSLAKPVDRGATGFTGTVNPGLIWAGRRYQVAVEASVPVNSRTGGGTGLLLQLHFFLDDLFPHSLGKPIFD